MCQSATSSMAMPRNESIDVVSFAHTRSLTLRRDEPAPAFCDLDAGRATIRKADSSRCNAAASAQCAATAHLPPTIGWPGGP